MILKSLSGEPLPVYGSGANVRDWLLVDDHAAVIVTALNAWQPGETYLIGGDSERTNMEVVEAVFDLVDAEAGPLESGKARGELIQLVADRPGHVMRYAIDASKAFTARTQNGIGPQ